MSPLDGALWSALLDHHLSGVRMQKARDHFEMAGLEVTVTACAIYTISVSYEQIDFLLTIITRPLA
jgi:hypothetical protein